MIDLKQLYGDRLADLTARQREIHGFIVAKVSREGCPPNVREIGQAFGIKSPNGVMCHLKALEKKGFINAHGFKACGIRLRGLRFVPVREGVSGG